MRLSSWANETDSCFDMMSIDFFRVRNPTLVFCFIYLVHPTTYETDQCDKDRTSAV